MLHSARLSFEAEIPGTLPDALPLQDDSFARHLVMSGELDLNSVLRAQELASQNGSPLAQTLVAHDLLSASRCAQAEARFCGLGFVDLETTPPDPRLIGRIGGAECLALGIVPWRTMGGITWIATPDRAAFDASADRLRACPGTLAPVIADRMAIQGAIARASRSELQARAEARVSGHWSAREWPAMMRQMRLPWILAAAAAIALAFPMVALCAVLVWMVLALGATTALRSLALLNRSLPSPAPPIATHDLPVITILVPMFNEPDIAQRLVRRIGRLDYPRDRLDVILVLEDCDTATRNALSLARLPPWMRVLSVPEGSPRTKPRAMNYALDFARGTIVGIYDAEDAPDPGQLRQVAAHFAQAAPDVACLQGVLDYYNPRTNALARWFTVEYAAWFRVVMPTLQRLGLPMPLGGTTLFLRRSVIDSLGAWDAHNVTEDADLGVRLARAGWRTEMLASTTEEEANCRLKPWLRQRSRWIKGHLLTWAVHMRDPAALWRDLGPKGFVGYQIVFLGAQSQVLLAPFMWSFWLAFVGLPHPVAAILPMPALYSLFALFLLAESLTIGVGILGVTRTRHAGLARWAPGLHVYHPLAALAGWRAVWETLFDPFSWAKTSHGHFDTVGIAVPHPQATGGAGKDPSPKPPAGRVLLFRRAELARKHVAASTPLPPVRPRKIHSRPAPDRALLG